MAFSRFRDRSGLVTRNRVIQYLLRERERREQREEAASGANHTNLFYMMGYPGQAPNRQSQASLI